MSSTLTKRRSSISAAQKDKSNSVFSTNGSRKLKTQIDVVHSNTNTTTTPSLLILGLTIAIVFSAGLFLAFKSGNLGYPVLVLTITACGLLFAKYSNIKFFR